MRLRVWLSLGLMLMAPAASAAAADIEPKRVLIVHSFGSSAPPFTTHSTAFETTLTRDMGKRVDLDEVALDMARYAQPDMEEPFAELLDKRLTKWRPDLVVPIGSPAGRFVAKFRDRLFPATPVIYTGMDRRTLPPDALQKNATFVGENFDLAGLVEDILQLAPDTEHIAVILGATPLERYWTAAFRDAFERFTNRVRFTWLNDLSFEQMLERAANMPPRSFILLGLLLRDASGVTHNEDDALQRLHAVANAPINGLYENQLGLGIVGGRLYQGERQGEEAARLAVRILRGELASSFPPLFVGMLGPRYDWRELRRWKISETRLPPGSDVRFRQPGLWDLYRWHIGGALSLFALQTGLIVALLTQRANRRRADLRFWQVVETAPYGMIIVGRDGRVAMANAQTEKLFRYRREELLGQPVEMLVPDRFRQALRSSCRFSSVPEARPMGAGQELFARRKDGGEFPVEIALSPAQPSAGRFVLATIVDISLRRQVEESLRLSQVELRRLTGRLLQAQEGEARRIARELHDDLGQGLALLTVEMDLLRQKPPEAAGELGARIQELLSLIRQMSSSVHDLSHQLHPSKLEQLGLVAAIRGLCHELTHSHGLVIEFKDHQIPAAISPDTAVCLYRIAQEGLRNAVKHSGAQRAEVELSGAADTISLRIIDDGTGFDPRSIQGKGGLGLVSIRERVLHLGGEIAIDSQPAAGTRIEVRIPVTETSQKPTE